MANKLVSYGSEEIWGTVLYFADNAEKYGANTAIYDRALGLKKELCKR